jgi:hypothetical protein
MRHDNALISADPGVGQPDYVCSGTRIMRRLGALCLRVRIQDIVGNVFAQ